MDKRDLVLQLSMPTVSAPMYSTFEASNRSGERIVVAGNGLFIEITRVWGHFIRRIGDHSMQLPFGEIQEVTTLHVPPLPRHLLAAFNTHAQVNAHTEVGASIVWRVSTNAFRLVLSTPTRSTGDLLDYEIPPLEADEHLVVDLHSHSRHRAFFSPQDDKDDKFAVKFSYVVGNCNLAVPTMEMRLCLKGIFQQVPLSIPSPGSGDQFPSTPAARTRTLKGSSIENHS